MNVSDKFFDLITLFEGFKKCPYKDSVGIPTIGIGTTVYPNGVRVKMTDLCISIEKAKYYVADHIKYIQAFLNANLQNLNQNQFDALVSFIYNIGLGGFEKSTLYRKAKVDVNDPSISTEFMKWNKAGGKVLAGLTKRRKQESDLYFKSE